MRKTKLLLLPMLMLGLLFSCGDSDDTEKPIVCPSKYDMTLNLNIKETGARWTKTVEGEVVSDVNYVMADLASIVYVVHHVESGTCVMYGNIGKNVIKEGIQKDGSFALHSLFLRFGKYHVSLIGTTDDQLTTNLIADGLSLSYDKAVCQVPNNHIFYSTMEVDCTNDAEKNKSVDGIQIVNADASIKHITGEFVFLLPKGDKKIPANANFSMEVSVTNLPSAFYIKNGQTLTAKETKDLGLYTYSNKFTITNRFATQFVVKYPLLANHNLPNTPAERGSFKFEYKEDLESSEVTKLVEIKMAERKQDENYFSTGETYFTDLYSTKEPEVVDPIIEE